MTSQPTTSQVAAALATVSSTPSASPFGPALYPIEVVQKLIDQTAYFPLYAVAERRGYSAGRGTVGVGIQTTQTIHRFQMNMGAPSRQGGVRAVNQPGEILGKMHLQWSMIAEDFVALPSTTPPPMAIDPSKSQRFTMLQTEFRFADGRDGFRCFGTGRTFPATQNGFSELTAGASANILDGWGIFERTQGTCIFAGRLDPEAGFIGSIVARIADPDDRMTVEVIPPVERRSDIQPEATYFLFRGQQQDSAPKPPPVAGGPQATPGSGFSLNQAISTIYTDCGFPGARGMRSSRQVGKIIGSQVATVHFDPAQLSKLAQPLGSIPFREENTFTFMDARGQNIAGLQTVASDGAIFNLQLSSAPLQRAVRIVGFGPASGGTGVLSGVGGLFHSVAFNALPPVPSSLYMVRIADPEGRYRE
jgi:hypothetical protein